MPTAGKGHKSMTPGPKIDMKYLQAEVTRAVSAAVDARFQGNDQLCIASADLNRTMARSECQCKVWGRETCSSTCTCRMGKKTCGIECDCRGFCGNSFATLPRLDVREGALGRELYTREDLPEHKLAFVMCGQIMTDTHFQRILQHSSAKHQYAVSVCLPGSSEGLPGEPGSVKYVVDPSNHVSGKANHSCEPNTVVGPCWSNGKVYAVGQTLRRIMSREALTYDYKWIGPPNGPVAELCFCRSINCRGLIADPLSQFMERSIQHYEEAVVRLLNKYEVVQSSLQDQLDALDRDREKGIDTEDEEIRMVRRQEKNDSLQVTCDRIQTAIVKARKAVNVARNIAARQNVGRARTLDGRSSFLQKRLPYPPPNHSIHPSEWSDWDTGIKGLDREWSSQLPLPLPLSPSLAFPKCQPNSSIGRPPWSPAGSHDIKGVHLKAVPFPTGVSPLHELPKIRKVRPQHPVMKPLDPVPEELADWPEEGFMTTDERQRVMSWIGGNVSARDQSRTVQPVESTTQFAFWLHARLRKPTLEEMQTFKLKWSGVTTQDLVERYEEETEDKRPPDKVVRCILSDVLPYIPFRYNNEVRMIESKAHGNRWPFAWAGQTSLPGAVPDYSKDLPKNQQHSELTSTHAAPKSS